MVEGIETVNGVLFVQLLKSSNTLSNFLTGKAAGKRELAKSLTLERMIDMRNAKRQALRDNLLKIPEPEPSEANAEVDKEAGLRLFAKPAASAHVPRHSADTWANRSKLRAQMPKTCEVEVKGTDGQSWKVTVLLSDKHGVSMEASQPNFEKLLAHVTADLQGGGPARKQHGTAVEARPKPKGEVGKREYFIRDRWRTKVRVRAPAAAPGAGQLVPFGAALAADADEVVPLDELNTPRKKKPAQFRVLSRRPTGEPSPERRPKRARPKAVRQEASAQELEDEAPLGF